MIKCTACVLGLLVIITSAEAQEARPAQPTFPVLLQDGGPGLASPVDLLLGTFDDQGRPAWADAIDEYLTGRDAHMSAFLEMPPHELEQQGKDAIALWRARSRSAEGTPHASDEQRLAVRRLQAAALLPLEWLLPLSAQSNVSSQMTALDNVGIAAWEALAGFEQLQMVTPGDLGRMDREQHRAALARFRLCWRVARLQYLVNAGRYEDFAEQASSIRLPSDERGLRAEYYVLRGMVEEVQGRRPRVPQPRRPGEPVIPESRLRDLNGAMDEATKWYRQALEDVDRHAEARMRLGRVHLDRSRPKDALRILQPLLTESCTHATCALAFLFAGEAHELDGAPDQAQRAYAIAVAVPAVRQSATVALMQLALRQGDRQVATALADQFSTGRPMASEVAPDLWSVYVGGRRPFSGALLRFVREARLP
jgi:hypothetical protein